MLNILQTGDLHLGKILYEYSLIEDQKHMLNSLLQELHSFHYDALIIAGDIYDRSIPTLEAVSTFDDFLASINTQFPSLSVCIISGNHDSQMRLGYASRFLRSLNIHICTNPNDSDTPVILQGKDGSKAALYQIPFLQAGSLKAENGELLKSQEDLMEAVVHRIQANHKKLQQSSKEYETLFAIANCHVFTLKGDSCDSERLFLGNAELINPSIFKPFLYTAIGHLHKNQKVTNNAYYAGAPLAYSFSEAKIDKCFLRIELDTSENKEINVSPIPITPLRKLVQIEASFEEFSKMKEYSNDFIEFTCTDIIPIENVASILRKTFPYILSIKQKAITNAYKNSEVSIEKKRTLFEKKEALPIRDILCSFLQDIGAIEEENPSIIDGEWKDSIDIFVKTAKDIEVEHETQ